METKLNIAEILKDKPKGIKLSSPIFGKCEFKTIYKNTYKGGTDTIEVKVNNSNEYFDETGKYYFNSSISHNEKPLLFPSEEMQDWSKFAWKKGDVLINNDKNAHVIFKGFQDDTYKTFIGNYYYENTENPHYSFLEKIYETKDFCKEIDSEAKTYINFLEKKFGGKLNLETLEIEAYVNVGDVVSDDVLYGICTKVDNSNVYCDFGCDSSKYNAPITRFCLRKANINVVMSINKERWYKEIEKKHHILIDKNTLKVQSEFKDGDIVCISGMGFFTYGIVKSIDNLSKKLEYYVLSDMSTLKIDDWLSFEDKQIQPITETQQMILFDTLAKENKAWDAEKKEIVNLKPDYKFKPFDKVVVYCEILEEWSCDIFSHYDKNYEGKEVIVCLGGGAYFKALPFNKETAKLLGTTNNAK